MIFVTGTKRSGTSMWMQILIEAGFPYIGEPYPRNWVKSIQEANKEGFYESSLRKGVYHQTNPNPKTGPISFRKRHDAMCLRSLLDWCAVTLLLSTMLWGQFDRGRYVQSIRRLYEMEDSHLATLATPEGRTLSPLGERPIDARKSCLGMVDGEL